MRYAPLTVAQVLDLFAGHPHPFPATLWRAWQLGNFDGDTITVRIDDGFHSATTRDVRLLGINAPELNTGTVESRANGLDCRNYLTSICPAGTALVLDTSLDPNPASPVEKYGRVLAHVTVYKSDGTTFDLSAAMLAFGHGVVVD